MKRKRKPTPRKTPRAPEPTPEPAPVATTAPAEEKRTPTFPDARKFS